MSKSFTAALAAVTGVFVLSTAAVFADEPGNPGFEDDDILIAPWTVVDKTGLNCEGDGSVVSGSDATEGDNFGRVSCFGYTTNGGDSDWGPAFKSETFFAGTGEEFAVDWRVIADGGYGSPSTGDAGFGGGWLVDASTDIEADEFFNTISTPESGTSPWYNGYTATAPIAGNYYLIFRVGSYDSTGGTVIGASLDIDNFMSLNSPPDCTAAAATHDMLWPPNHKAHDIQIAGVTDPDGDSFDIMVTSIKQDEPVNSHDDGDTCPDASGVGTDSASVLAERVGGEFGSEGDGRFYSIYFTATDVNGASCDGLVKVNVPHSKKETGVDGGPLFDSTQCP